jgi:hypothetical protein
VWKHASVSPRVHANKDTSLDDFASYQEFIGWPTYRATKFPIRQPNLLRQPICNAAQSKDVVAEISSATPKRF